MDEFLEKYSWFHETYSLVREGRKLKHQNKTKNKNKNSNRLYLLMIYSTEEKNKRWFIESAKEGYLKKKLKIRDVMVRIYIQMKNKTSAGTCMHLRSSSGLSAAVIVRRREKGRIGQSRGHRGHGMEAVDIEACIFETSTVWEAVTLPL